MQNVDSWRNSKCMDSGCKDSANCSAINDESVFDEVDEGGSETEISVLYPTHSYKETNAWTPVVELQTPFTVELAANRDSGEGRFICDTCQLKVEKLSFLAIHQRFHTTQRHFKCPECHGLFYSLNELSIHCQKHTMCLIECRACNGRFQDPGLFKLHLEIHRIELDDIEDEVEISDECVNVERAVLYNEVHYLNEMIFVKSLGAAKTSYLGSFTCKHCYLKCTSKVRLFIHELSHKHTMSGQIYSEVLQST